MNIIEKNAVCLEENFSFNFRHKFSFMMQAMFSILFRIVMKCWVVIQILPPFFKVTFSKQGLGSKDGQILLIGKFRRIILSAIPILANALRKHYGLEGSCHSCGASCKLLFQCPHWDDDSHLCTVYEFRPDTCRYFPMTPSDIRDRNLVLKNKPCGFTFKK